MAEAQYFHATVDCFAPEAYNEVIRRFHNSVQDVSARCWYDVQQDMFCLTSPTAIGQQANSILNDVLNGFVEEERAAAERDDHAPRIKSFADGVLEDDDITCEVGNDHPAPEVRTPSLSLPQNDATTTMIILHFINLEQSTNTRIKLFLLSELPDGMVDRIICSTENHSKKAIQTGVAARSVRWDAVNQVYIFNGRVGSPVHIDKFTNARLLSETRFGSVSDSRGFQEPASQVKNVPVQYWDFPPGEATDVNRFLEGMGQIETIDPNTAAEVPEDAARFLSESNRPQLPQGRPRVPRADHTESSADDSDDNDGNSDNGSQSSSNATNKDHGTQAQNLKANTTNVHRIFGVSLSDAQMSGSNGMSSMMSATIRADGEKTPTGSKAFPSSSTPPRLSTNIQSGKQKSNATPFGSIGKDERSKTTNTRYSSNEDDKRSTSVVDFPDWAGKYAAVDKVGLTGVATNQATWIHENPSPKKRASKSGISLRPASTQSRPATSLLSAISSVTRSVHGPPNGNARRSSGTPSSSCSLASPRLVPQDSARSSPQKWSSKVVLPKASDQKLIDDFTTIEAKPSTKPPPGLYGYEKAQSSTALRQVTSAPGNTTQSSNSTANPNLLDDMSDHENEMEGFNNIISHLRIQGASRSNKPTPPHQSFRPSHSHHTNSDPNGLQEDGRAGNVIIERLEVAPDDSNVKRYTMNQKAKKPKSRKPDKRQDVNKVVLPKPDPVPVIQSNKLTMEAALNSNATLASKQMQASHVLPRPSSPDEPQEPEKSSSPAPIAIQQLVNLVTSAGLLEGAAVYVRFGMLLVQDQQVQKPMQRGAITKDLLQAKLQSSESSLDVTFIPRLTTSTSDALFLLDLVQDSTVSATTQYEIVVKNAEGDVRIIKMENVNKDSFQVFFPCDLLGTSYLHYPIRIWDAKSTVEKTISDNSMDGIVNELISSMQTIDEAPSFVAKVPSGSFSIEKVCAKRVFFKTISNRVELFVTEVQDLVLESINDARYNFKAAVLPGEEMVNSQCRWWECELRAEVVDDETAARLQGLTDVIVSEMDGVGYANKGPWEKTSVEEVKSCPEEWFW